ncbi:aminotransferase class V-fold PLP-dependent enzyme [Streptomyces sp. DSM 44915]|uniref:Aminotransferase class V-fold PLP-dependent enzyme n=1 Tax=Streptomyces chisholmiae TaxID=3075540 RepID=A0ABU2JR18_9ACTN|nr:aminotransferase class V-fold PLP-dependent enzyme [Streptomyces sp. DSM 44915]MDT0267382.1 aminotransferase class V-fold PLP-dependent enzyme [Streptomyces sp. DSM 44915]
MSVRAEATPAHTHHTDPTGSETATDPRAVLSAGVTVPLADGRVVGYAALDYAASAPVLSRVWDEVARYAPSYGSVHRGAGQLSRLSTELFERSRATVAGFLGLRPTDRLLFTRSTTDSLNLLAAALPAGTRVLVFETEHHAALLPWAHHGHRVDYLATPDDPAAAVRAVEEALADGPVGPTLLCVTGASNVTGELWPVRELAAAAHRHGARIVLDAAQLVPHRPVDVRAWDVDWVAFSGHKLYAPFGAGVLAGRADWLDAAPPYLAGGGATRVVSREAGAAVRVVWADGETRHEAGSPNVIGALAVAAACRALTEGEGYRALVAHERALLGRLRAGLAELPRVRELSLFGPAAERVAVVSFTVAGWDSAEFARALADRYGIGVRSGMFCAQPLVRRLLGADGPADDCGGPLQAVRVSFGAGTPAEHVERLLAAVAELTGGRAG